MPLVAGAAPQAARRCAWLRQALPASLRLWLRPSTTDQPWLLTPPLAHWPPTRSDDILHHFTTNFMHSAHETRSKKLADLMQVLREWCGARVARG